MATCRHGNKLLPTVLCGLASGLFVACTPTTDVPDGATDASMDGAVTHDVFVRPDGVSSDIVPTDGNRADSTAPDVATRDVAPVDADAGSCNSVDAPGADLPRYRALLRCLGDVGTDDSAASAAIERFVRAVEAGDGFPIVAEGRTVFVYVRDARFDAEDDANGAEDYAAARRRGPITVAGDFNAWQEGATPMTEARGRFFHVDLPSVLGTGARVRYKFVARDEAGAAVWFSDPLSRRFLFDPSGRISLVRGDGTAGHLEWIRQVTGSTPEQDRPLFVHVPAGYDTEGADRRHPVLYMQDGRNAFDPQMPGSSPVSWDADGVIERETQAGRVRPSIVVAVPAHPDRIHEYTHVRDRVGTDLVGGGAGAYLTFLTGPVRQTIDARYRTLRGRTDTAILGSSLGGLVSFYAGLERPDVFGCVAAMSATFWWGTSTGGPTMLTRYAQTTGLASRMQRFYLDSGGGPPASGICPEDTSQGSMDNYCATRAMQSVLERQGIQTYPDDPNASPLTPASVNIYHWYDPGAPHAESAWNTRLHRALRLCLGTSTP